MRVTHFAGSIVPREGAWSGSPATLRRFAIRLPNQQHGRPDPGSRAGRGDEGSAYREPPGAKRRRNLLKPMIPLLIMAGFGVFIAYKEVPAVADLLERTFTPERWQIKQACRNSALAELSSGQYARPLDGGELHQTQDGPYVSRMKFAVLGEDGRERTVEYNCYLDGSGQLVKLSRQTP